MIKKLIHTRDFYLASNAVDNIMPVNDLPLYKILLELKAKPQIDFEFSLKLDFRSDNGDDHTAHYDFFPPVKSKDLLVGFPNEINKEEISVIVVKWDDDAASIKKKEPLIFDLSLYEIDEEMRSTFPNTMR